MTLPTIQDRFDTMDERSTGFDYLRLFLACFIVVWHAVWVVNGSLKHDQALWDSWYRFAPASVLPMFFSLSGFLVANSLMRTKLHQFLVLRVIRLVPALAVETLLCALVIGLAFTAWPRQDYLLDKNLYAYFLNIIGIIHYQLPGVFRDNVGGSSVNEQLWTIPYEMQSYTILCALSLLSFIRKRQWFLLVFLVATTLWLGASLSILSPPFTHAPGGMLVMSFFSGVILYVYRDRAPCSGLLAFVAACMALIYVRIPQTYYAASLPLAYLTVWLGLRRLPKLAIGDLSYGLFLFHYPIEQTIMYLHPEIQNRPILLLLMAGPLTFGMAWLSWNLVEKPILSHKKEILAAVDRLIEWKFPAEQSVHDVT